MHRLEGILGCCSVCHIHSTLFSETGSLAGLDWLARDPPGMHCFPSARITRTHHYFFLIIHVFVFQQIRVSMLAQQVISHLHYLDSPSV